MVSFFSLNTILRLVELMNTLKNVLLVSIHLITLLCYILKVEVGHISRVVNIFGAYFFGVGLEGVY